MKLTTRWPLVAACAALAACLLVWDFAPHAAMKTKPQKTPIKLPGNTGYRSPAEQHKLKVSDGELARQLVARGATLVADYGSYLLLEADSATAAALTSSDAIELSDEQNLVMLNTGAIDTTKLEARASRAPAGAFTGRRLHLIQFAGPVKSEWYDALARTGVRIVAYIPHNTFLIYGDATQVAAVHTLADTSNFIQWDSAYASAYRINSAIGASEQNAKAKDTTGAKAATGADTARANKLAQIENSSRVETDARDNKLCAMQLVQDRSANAATLRLIKQLMLGENIEQQAVLGYVNVIARLPVATIYKLAARPDVVSIAPYVSPVQMDERQDMIVAGQLSGN